MRFFITVLTLMLAVSASSKELEGTGPNNRSNRITVTEKEFGLFDGTEYEKLVFTPTATVPLVSHQLYGWRLKVNGILKSVLVKHELHLPAPAKNWDAHPAMKVSADRTSCVVVENYTVHNGYIFHVWAVADDDPEGEYSMRIFVENELVAIFKFFVKR